MVRDLQQRLVVRRRAVCGDEREADVYAVAPAGAIMCYWESGGGEEGLPVLFRVGAV